MKPWEPAAHAQLHNTSDQVRRHLRESGQLSEGSKDAEALKWGPDQERKIIRTIVEASIHTLLHPLRDRPFYIDKITASTGRKWDIPVWKGSDEPLPLTSSGYVRPDSVTAQANLCLGWTKFEHGLQG